MREGARDMEVALRSQLSEEKEPKDLVPNPLLVRC